MSKKQSATCPQCGHSKKAHNEFGDCIKRTDNIQKPTCMCPWRPLTRQIRYRRQRKEKKHARRGYTLPFRP